MDTKTLKISLAQRILSIADINVLKQIDKILQKENIIGFDAFGKPITEENFLKEMEEINKEIDNQTTELLTTEQVVKKIKDENSLA